MSADAVGVAPLPIQGLIPNLVRSALAEPIQRLRQQLGPAAQRTRQHELVRD